MAVRGAVVQSRFKQRAVAFLLLGLSLVSGKYSPTRTAVTPLFPGGWGERAHAVTRLDAWLEQLH